MSELTNFLAIVFDPEQLQTDDHICYSSKADKEGGVKQPVGYPQGQEAFDKAMRGKGARATYMGTSTMRLDPESGRLYNRQGLFTAMWVLVLDDVGTGAGAKCRRDELPAGVWDGCTYRIETSPGNYQLGFIFEEPIRDLASARELVKIVYAAGNWDSGGATCCKWVRLPGSANLKDKYGEYGERFIARLDYLDDGKFFTPQELLDLVDAGVSWVDIEAGHGPQMEPRRSRGTTAYATGITLDMAGVIDPFAEWLAKEGLVVNERGDWLDVPCPWADTHTDGDGLAGYSPLGWGSNEAYRSMRTFHCFHGHCEHNKAREFIAYWVEHSGGKAPLVPVHDPAGILSSQYLYNASTDKWLNIMCEPHREIPAKGFTVLHSEKMWIPKVTAGGEVQWIGVTAAKLITDTAVKVAGSQYRPGAALIVNDGPEKVINTCRLPFYGTGPVTQVDVDIFREYVLRLCPEKDDGEWMIRHLAAKVQNPKYRGPGVFMYTSTTGVGRGTLQHMIEKLWGREHVSSPSMERLLKGLNGDAKNDELQALWVIVPEADDRGSAKHNHYAQLKGFIEPAPVIMTYDQKYGGRWTGPCYASVMICSNNYNGLTMDGSDRRIKRIPNNTERPNPEYFTRIHQWLATDWMPSVWRYLQQYDIGDYTGSEPQDDFQDDADRDDRVLAMSAIDKAVALAKRYYAPHRGVFAKTADIITAFRIVSLELGLNDLPRWVSAAEDVIRKQSSALRGPDGERRPVRGHDGVQYKPRAFGTGTNSIVAQSVQGGLQHSEVADHLAATSVDGLAKYLKEAIEALD